MATADEKAAKQAARDAARQSAVVGQQRQQAEITRAASAFPVRRLRSAGDLSRYAIGGFLDDPLSQGVNPTAPGARQPVRTPKPAPAAPATSSTRIAPRSSLPAPVPLGRPAPAARPNATTSGGGPGVNRVLSGGVTRDLDPRELARINESKGIVPTTGARPVSGPAVNRTLSGGVTRDLSSQERNYINRARSGSTRSRPKPKPRPKPKAAPKRVSSSPGRRLL